MSKPVRVEAVRQTKPELRKLARALLMLAEQENSQAPKKPSKRSPDRKAS